MRKDKIRVYRDRRGMWRWTRYASNGNKVADSAEGYVRKTAAWNAAIRESDPPEAEVEVVEELPGG